MLHAATATPRELEAHGLLVNRDGARRSAFELAAQAQFPIAILARVWPQLADIPANLVRRLEADAKYSVYLDRQAEDVARYRRDDSAILPADLDYAPPLGALQRNQAEVHRRSPGEPGSGPPHRGRHSGRFGAHRRACEAGGTILGPQSAAGGDVSRPPKTLWRTNSQTIARRLCALSLFHVKQRIAWRPSSICSTAGGQDDNLIANSTFPSVWTRHIANSAQLIASRARGQTLGRHGLRRRLSRPRDRNPARRRPGAVVHCIESDQRKCAFLREAARATGAAAAIHPERVEAIEPISLGAVDAVTARAFAPLPLTLKLARPWMERGAMAVFPRGESARDQIAALPGGDGLCDRNASERRQPEGRDPAHSPKLRPEPMTDDRAPRSRARRRGASARSRHGEPEGRRRQDNHRHQPRDRARRDRRAGAHHRSRSPGQRLDRPRHQPQGPRDLELRHAGRREVLARRRHSDLGAAPLHRPLDHGSSRRRARNRWARRPLL